MGKQTKDDQVFCNAYQTNISFMFQAGLRLNHNSLRPQRLQLTGVNDVHSTHSTAGIVEDPLLIQIHITPRVLLTQLTDNIVDNLSRIIAMGANCTCGQISQLSRCEDIERFQMRIQEVEKRREDTDYGCHGGEKSRHGGRYE
jgi:hypothetical protein